MIPSTPLHQTLETTLTRATESLALAHAILQTLAHPHVPEHLWRSTTRFSRTPND